MAWTRRDSLFCKIEFSVAYACLPAVESPWHTHSMEKGRSGTIREANLVQVSLICTAATLGKHNGSSAVKL